MTIVDDRAGEGPGAADTEVAPTSPVAAPPPPPAAGTVPPPGAERKRPVNPTITSIAVLLSSAAAGFMAAGVFRGVLPKLIGLIGPIVGTGVIALSYRTRRPSSIQYLVLPVALAAGALVVLPFTTGGTANLPSLVLEAVETGGVAQPPIPFDPGWRFILVVLTAIVAASAASLAIALNRPTLGVVIPLPVVFAAALVQPAKSTVLTSAVALALIVTSMAVSYGADLEQDDATTGRFETRRLLNAAGIGALLVAILVAVNQAGFLFPATDDTRVSPPRRPEPQPPASDRVVFRVTAGSPGPWRLGVLDVYQDGAWMLPPYDLARFEPLDADGATSVPPRAPTPGDPDGAARVRAEFEIVDVEGHVIPGIAGATTVVRDGFAVTYDPRTEMLRLPDGRAQKGMRYSVEAPPPPNGAQLAASGTPPPALDEFLDVPPAPPEIEALLRRAPESPFTRLQFVRDELYKQVIAAGAGQPVDVPPFRVAEMLAGSEATPYEITAAEGLLARWAGIPARIGYGFYGGEREGNGFEIHPRHGATWLEAYFDGYGWVAVIGTPPRAKASLSDAEKQDNPEIRPSERLALKVYAPVRRESVRLLFEVVRYWLVRAVPAALLSVLAWGFFPGAVKAARRWRRRRWARAGGPSDEILVAYTEFRDAAHDLNVGDPTVTPLRFLDHVDIDVEHAELAWLTTRTLWGDLARDVRPEDADIAREMARSVTKRLRRAQPVIAQVVAIGTRASLREPFTDEVPNLWPAWARPGAVGRLVRAARRRVWRQLRTLRPGAAHAALLLVVALLMSACVPSNSLVRPSAAGKQPVLPDPILPDELHGLTVQREESAEVAWERAGPQGLVAEGRVYTLRQGADVKGALQVGAFKPGLRGKPRVIREGFLDGVEAGRFEPVRVGGEPMFVQRGREQRILVWFSPRTDYYEMLVASPGFDDAEAFFTAVLAYQRGEAPPEATTRSELPDPRRGPPE